MPDIILLNNTPGLSLSAPYANLSPYITSLYESNGLGFKGFSINDLGPTSEYKFTSDLYKNDKDNFKFFDIILKDVPGAVPGDSLDSLGLKGLNTINGLHTYYNSNSLFYYNIRWSLQSNGTVPQRDFFNQVNPAKKPHVYINFSNNLQQDFLIYYPVTANIELTISCGGQNAIIEVPAFIRPDGSPFSQILFVKKPKKLTSNDIVTIKAKSVLKDQKLNNKLPEAQSKPIPNTREYRLYGIDANNTAKLEDNRVRVNDRDANYYTKWDFIYSDIFDFMEDADDPIRIASSEKRPWGPNNKQYLHVTAQSDIPNAWERIRIEGHSVSAANAVWSIDHPEDNNQVDTTTVILGPYDGSPGLNNGLIKRYTYDSTTIPNLDNVNLYEKPLNAAFNKCIKDRIHYLNRGNNLKKEIELMLSLYGVNSNEGKALKKASDILDGGNCKTSIKVTGIKRAFTTFTVNPETNETTETDNDNRAFTLSQYEYSNDFPKSIFLGDTNNIILQFKYKINVEKNNDNSIVLQNNGYPKPEINKSKQIFIVNIIENTDAQFQQSIYSNSFPK